MSQIGQKTENLLLSDEQMDEWQDGWKDGWTFRSLQDTHRVGTLMIFTSQKSGVCKKGL